MSPDEMKASYQGHMINVFPENELKPCDSIYNEMLEGKYLACGLYAGEELVGYVFTACMPEREQLFGQYVVVKEEYRSMGVGAVMMDKVMQHYSGYRCFMADVEDPDYPVDNEDRQARERRMRFYIRNGFRRTRVKAHVYGVDYEVIVRDISAHVDDKEVLDSANAIYESMSYPGTFPEMFQLRIEYKLNDRGMCRREFKKLADTSLRTMRADIDGFSGIVGIMDINRVTADWYVSSAGIETLIAAEGYKWMQLAPDNEKWWLTVMFNEHGKLVQFYFDVIHSKYTADDGELRFRDMFLDVVMDTAGRLEVRDREELETALANGVIYQSEYEEALRVSADLLQRIKGKEEKWKSLCYRILKMF